MRHRDFCYWLQGFAEVQKPENGLTKEQWEEVKKHLALCFNYEETYPADPDRWNFVRYMPQGSC